MARDIVLMDKSKELEDFGRELGFSKIYFKNEIRGLCIEYIEDYDKKRKAIENGKIEVLLNPHLVIKKDSLHFRSSGLDQVLCKFMRKNQISMGLSLDKI